jgi:serine/threonine-protein kinase
MVAAAGERGGVRPIVGVACVVAVIVALALYARVNMIGKVSHYDPLEKPPAVLADRAQEILAGIGHDEPFQDSAHGFVTNNRLLFWIGNEDESADRWERIRDARPAGVHFWYRQSPRALLPMSPNGIVTQEDPPPLLPGMAQVLLDTRGRLVSLHIVPPQEEPKSVGETDWEAVLRVAGLDPDRLERTEPQWVPPVHGDERVAWVGRYTGGDDLEMRFEGTALAGRPVHLRTVGPWTEPFQAIEEEDEPVQRWGEFFLLGVITVVLFGGVFLAIRNVRMGRGDLKSARLLSLGVFFILGARWVLIAPHTGDFNDELNLFLLAVAMQLLVSATVWCFYLALEPYVRKWWPEQLVAWSRVFTGRWRDPLVGRDILVGGVFFLFLTVPEAVNILAAQASVRPLGTPGGYPFMWFSWLGVEGMLATALSSLMDAIFYGLFFLLCILFLRFLVRSQRAALGVFALAVGFVYFMDASANDGNRVIATVIGIGSGLGYSFVLHRFGLLPFIFGFFLRNLTTRFPVVFDGGAWYSGSSAFVVVVIVGLAAYGLWVALAGKSVLRDWLLDEA